MKQSNQPNFASFLSRQDGLTPPRSQKRQSNAPANDKPYEGLLGRKLTAGKNGGNTNAPTDRNESKDYFAERISASPLKLPLSRAIEKTVKNMGELDRSRRLVTPQVAPPPPLAPSRKTMSKRHAEDSSYYLKQEADFDEIDQILKHMHHETMSFLNKYFQPSLLGEIPLELFINKVIQQHQNLWSNQQAQQILDVFIERMTTMLGGDTLDLRLLQVLTKEDGIIGLILQIFKELKQQENSTMINNRTVLSGYGGSPTHHNCSTIYNNNMSTLKKSFQERLTANSTDIQNIKNIIQEFMETMYKCMENEIYSKFQVEMRRMVLKYRDTEKILKIVNDKITHNIDVFHADQKRLEKQRQLQSEIHEWKEKLQKQEILMQKEKMMSRNVKIENEKLQAEVKRLTESLQKFQNHILKQNEYDPTMSRQVSLPVIDPVLSRHVSQPQIFTTALTPMTPPGDKPTTGKSAFADYYEQQSLVNQTSALDISNISGYKSTSIVAPSLTGGNIKVNINHEIVQKDPGSSMYGASISPILQRSISVGFQTNRENMRLDNFSNNTGTITTSMTPPKLTITRVEHSPFNKSRVTRIS